MTDSLRAREDWLLLPAVLDGFIYLRPRGLISGRRKARRSGLFCLPYVACCLYFLVAFFAAAFLAAFFAGAFLAAVFFAVAFFATVFFAAAFLAGAFFAAFLTAKGI